MSSTSRLSLWLKAYERNIAWRVSEVTPHPGLCRSIFLTGSDLYILQNRHGFICFLKPSKPAMMDVEVAVSQSQLTWAGKVDGTLKVGPGRSQISHVLHQAALQFSALSYRSHQRLGGDSPRNCRRQLSVPSSGNFSTVTSSAIKTDTPPTTAITSKRSQDVSARTQNPTIIEYTERRDG